MDVTEHAAAVSVITQGTLYPEPELSQQPGGAIVLSVHRSLNLVETKRCETVVDDGVKGCRHKPAPPIFGSEVIAQLGASIADEEYVIAEVTYHPAAHWFGQRPADLRLRSEAL